MKKLNFNLLIISIITLWAVSTATAQDEYKIDPDNSTVTIKGTSTLHDWEMTATEITAGSLFTTDGNTITSVQRTRFTAPVSGLKSGKSIMDNKAHEALKKREHPQITFRAEKSYQVNISGEETHITGELSIAGKTKTITFSVDLNPENPEVVYVRGEVPLKMSDFGIDPPTAMMGAVKTDDDLTVTFDMEFRKSNEAFTRKF